MVQFQKECQKRDRITDDLWCGRVVVLGSQRLWYNHLLVKGLEPRTSALLGECPKH